MYYRSDRGLTLAGYSVGVQFGSTGLAKSLGLWETVGMSKRELRIVKVTAGVPLVGVCEYCSQTFTAAAHPLGKASKTDVRDQFEAHTCKRQDASQAA